MAASVRTNPLREIEQQRAAERRGMAKLQFIIAAVKHALDRKSPHKLLNDAAALMQRHAKTQRTEMGFANASFAWLAAHNGVYPKVTTDVRAFSRHRLPNGRAFEIL
jgi:trans-aconitate methyltransferase